MSMDNHLCPMNKESLLEQVKAQLTEKRYIHTLGVVQTSMTLAQRFEADVARAELAAICHDYAKFRNEEEMAQIIRTQKDIPNDLLAYHKELWHAPVGAYLVQQELGITDEDVLQAIRYHTTGRVGMSIVEKVVCLADYIEPGRRFPGVEKVRQLAEDNLDHALAQALNNTIQFIKNQGQKVYPLTIAAYQDLRP